VVAEALTNIAKHSGATTASVTARQHHHVLTVEASDNGHGGADSAHGTGLTGLTDVTDLTDLTDRVAVTGGRICCPAPRRPDTPARGGTVPPEHPPSG